MATEPRAERLGSLDVFRGATVAAMILVNNAGDWDKTYGPLLHAEWHGWTPTDLIFPFFLFIVGVAIPYAFAGRLQRSGGDFSRLHGQIAKRALILFALGLFLSWFPFYTVDWSAARIPGVLQRIAVVYVVAALAWLHLGARSRALLAAALLTGSWLAMILRTRTRVWRRGPEPGRERLRLDRSPHSGLAHLAEGTRAWRSGRDFQHVARHRHRPGGPVHGRLVAVGPNPARETVGAAPLGSRPGHRRARSSSMVSNQQKPLDQHLRAVHRRPGVAAARRDLRPR